MNSFLPYSDFAQSAKSLDRARLGKQRLEVRQMLNVLKSPSGKTGWLNHPCTQQWKYNHNSLVEYGLAICSEWIARGYKDNQYPIIKGMYDKTLTTNLPGWLGREEFHSSHRQTLLSKNFEWYSQFGWCETPVYEYWWPSKNGF